MIQWEWWNARVCECLCRIGGHDPIVNQEIWNYKRIMWMRKWQKKNMKNIKKRLVFVLTFFSVLTQKWRLVVLDGVIRSCFGHINKSNKGRTYRFVVHGSFHLFADCSVLFSHFFFYFSVSCNQQKRDLNFARSALVNCIVVVYLNI